MNLSFFELLFSESIRTVAHDYLEGEKEKEKVGWVGTVVEVGGQY